MNTAITHPYTAADGSLLYTIRRTIRRTGRGRDKVVRPYLPGADTPGIGDAPRLLYRLPAVRRQAAAGGTVVVVEGERDADALVALGLCATTPVFGSWRSEYCAALAGATVAIIADRDEAGVAKARERRDCLTACGVAVLGVWRTPLRERGADVSDHLAASLPLEELEPVPEWVLWGLPVDDNELPTGEQWWRAPEPVPAWVREDVWKWRETPAI